MTAFGSQPLHGRALGALRSALCALLLAGLPASAALPPGSAPAPELLSPPPDARMDEMGLRFAWKPSPGSVRQWLLISRAPFETSGWTRIEDAAAIETHPVTHPLAAFAELGIGLGTESLLYWAVAEEQSGTGRVAFSAARSVRVRPRFVNRVAPHPLLGAPQVGAARPAAPGEPLRVRLGAGLEFDPRQGEPALPSHLRLPRSAADGASRTVLVHYGDHDPEAARGAILAAGGTVAAYVPDHTFLARMPAGEGPRPDLGSAAVWVGDYAPAYKLSPRLSLQPGDGVSVDVLVFPDGDLAAVAARARGLGGQVTRTSDNRVNKLLRVTLAPEALAALAAHDDVEWLEPTPRNQTNNDLAQWVVQTFLTNLRRVWDMGIHGEGQVINTTDSGIDVGHEQFRDPGVPLPDFGDYPTHRKLIAYQLGSDNPAVEFGDHGVLHGSHTAGTAGGTDDPLGTGNARDGMAKAAKLYFMDISGSSLGNGVEPFADLNDLFQPPYDGNAGGAARISSNSWGANVGGAYTLNAMQVDQFMWSHPDFLIFFSNGNAGSAGSVGSPATAKDCVSAGGTRNGTTANQIYTSTSRGPTQDGRRKPTICSPGQSVTSANVAPNFYATLSGTSMASPSMAGAAALVRQYVTDGWYPTGAPVPANGFAPSAALLKAMCVNSADNGITGFTAPDFNIGYGRIDADNVCYFPGDARKLLLEDNTQGLAHGQAIEYQVNVTSGAVPLEVTLCWTDYPGNPVSAVQLVNDLDLTLTNGVVTYKGNVYSAGFSAAGGIYDNRNVEEACLVNAPATGLWTVRIEGTNVPFGPQPFGLCITGGVGNGAGTLALDRASYGSNSIVYLQVVDTDAGASVDVNVASTTDPTGKLVTISGSDGVYDGSVQLTPSPQLPPPDPRLQVSHGDVITATYVDASPSATLTAQAGISLAPPVITAVSAASQGNRSVLVSWTTSENATSKVYYGPTPDLGSATTVDPTSVLQHQVTIGSLTVNQTYFYDVESTDLDGNLTRDDNGGAHYRFTVNPPSDLLLVYGGPSFERPDRYAAALSELGWSYDVWQGPLSDDPDLGDLDGGMRAYKAVWWQPGLDYYPPISDPARTQLQSYLDGGGRLCVTGHDVVWALADPSSPYYTAARQLWVQNTLHSTFNLDPTVAWTSVRGIAADPISGAYTGTIPYAQHRAGASGDDVDSFAGAGTTTYDWISTEALPDHNGLRWESSGPLGTPGTGFWAGSNSRLATMYFEWSGIDNASTPSSVTRRDVMDKTLTWLLGRMRPTATVISPNGGETLTGDTAPIQWSETVAGGFAVASRTLEYSTDGGSSWNTIASGALSSPYSWDLTSVPNTPSAKVRVSIADDGTPALTNADLSNQVFAILRATGDAQGPAVVAGSIAVSPNPVDNQQPATLTATVSDLASGGADIVAAEWSVGDIPAAAGSGTAMTGSFDVPSLAVSGTVPAGLMQLGTGTLWVRGRDAAGNWGNPRSLQVAVNGVPVTGVDPSRPAAYELRQNAPNPVTTGTEIVYALPREGPVELAIYDVLGRKLRALTRGRLPAGVHRARWDLLDDRGERVAAGLYYYRLTVPGRSIERVLVALR